MIKIMADSPCDIPKGEAQQYDIQIFPVELFMSDCSYRDNVDISTAEFYEKLKQTDEFPTTSQIGILDFEKAFLEAAKQGYDEVMCFTLPLKASGTHQNAHLAKNMVADKTDMEITIIDSGTFSYIYGRMIVEAAKMAKQDCTHDQIMEKLTYMRDNHYVLIATDTLKYLKKGGRINPAVANIGEILQIKPILSVDDGLISSAAKVKGQKRVFPKILELLKENGLKKATEITILQGDAIERALEFSHILHQEAKTDNIYITEVGPVIGIHTGPGVIAVILWK